MKRVSGILRSGPLVLLCGRVACVRAGGGELALALLKQLMPVRPTAKSQVKSTHCLSRGGRQGGRREWLVGSVASWA